MRNFKPADKIGDGKKSGACGTRAGHIKFYSETMKERDRLGDLSVHGRILLK
jgi:hypothetical protein